MRILSCLSLVSFLLVSAAAQADNQAVNATVNFATPGLISWRYDAQKNTYNGVVDHQASVRFEFAGDGFVEVSSVQVPVPGLRWNADFTQVIYDKMDGTQALCAYTAHRRLIADLRACSLTGGLTSYATHGVDDFTHSNVVSVYQATLNVN